MERERGLQRDFAISLKPVKLLLRLPIPHLIGAAIVFGEKFIDMHGMIETIRVDTVGKFKLFLSPLLSLSSSVSSWEAFRPQCL